MMTARPLKKYFSMEFLGQLDTRMVHALRDIAEKIEKEQAKQMEKSQSQQQNPGNNQNQQLPPNFGNVEELTEVLEDAL